MVSPTKRMSYVSDENVICSVLALSMRQAVAPNVPLNTFSSSTFRDVSLFFCINALQYMNAKWQNGSCLMEENKHLGLFTGYHTFQKLADVAKLTLCQN